jgi:hypothetical protein
MILNGSQRDSEIIFGYTTILVPLMATENVLSPNPVDRAQCKSFDSWGTKPLSTRQRSLMHYTPVSSSTQLQHRLHPIRIPPAGH